MEELHSGRVVRAQFQFILSDVLLSSLLLKPWKVLGRNIFRTDDASSRKFVNRCVREDRRVVIENASVKLTVLC